MSLMEYYNSTFVLRLIKSTPLLYSNAHPCTQLHFLLQAPEDLVYFQLPFPLQGMYIGS